MVHFQSKQVILLRRLPIQQVAHPIYGIIMSIFSRVSGTGGQRSLRVIILIMAMIAVPFRAVIHLRRIVLIFITLVNLFKYGLMMGME